LGTISKPATCTGAQALHLFALLETSASELQLKLFSQNHPSDTTASQAKNRAATHSIVLSDSQKGVAARQVVNAVLGSLNSLLASESSPSATREGQASEANIRAIADLFRIASSWLHQTAEKELKKVDAEGGLGGEDDSLAAKRKQERASLQLENVIYTFIKKIQSLGLVSQSIPALGGAREADWPLTSSSAHRISQH
jgi:hypothetical protein